MVHFALPTVWDALRVIYSRGNALLILFLMFFAVSLPSRADAPLIDRVSTDWLGGVPENGRLAYEITRKGKRLGFQTLDFTTLDNGDLQVDVHIEIDFKIIFPLFRYLHDNREVWRDGKLLSLTSKTDNNGEDEFVRLRAEEGKLVGAGTKFTDNLTSDMLTTSYFNPNFIRQTALVSTQDGRRLDTGIEIIGREVLQLQTGRVEATRFRLSGKLRIDIWYTDSGRWVKTEFIRGGNKLIVQEVNPASIPQRKKWRHP